MVSQICAYTSTVCIILRCEADEEEDGDIAVSEAVEQALNTRSKGILKHISCISPETYSDVKELRVWASTFNVNGEKPQPDHDFRSWLVHPGDLSDLVSSLVRMNDTSRLAARFRDVHGGNGASFVGTWVVV